MTSASELRSKARESLNGRWNLAVKASFIALFLGVGNLGFYILAAIDWFEKFEYNDPTGQASESSTLHSSTDNDTTESSSRVFTRSMGYLPHRRSRAAFRSNPFLRSP